MVRGFTSLLSIIITKGASLTLYSVLVALLIYFNIHLRKELSSNDLKRATDMRELVASWGTIHSRSQAQAQDPISITQGITPIPCHSHNDYWRQIPLYEALAAGCTGTEADVWLSGSDLLVGHTKSSLSPSRSLATMYINPLVSILTHQNQNPPSNSTPTNTTQANGIFESDPVVPLTLLLDMKSSGPDTFPVVLKHLEPLRSRGWLTHYNGTTLIPGPITVVGTGNTPFPLVLNTTAHDIFFDAPLAQFWGESAPSNATAYTAQNSNYASTSFAETVGKLWHGVMSPSQVEIVRGQVAEATKRGLKARYWDTPSWPVGVREHVWDVLVKEGVGMLSVDDVDAASKRKW